MADAPPDLDYCADLVRRMDPDHFYAVLLAPAEVRAALFTLYAFDHEIGKVHVAASEAAVGTIRLKWWYDALDTVKSGEVASHPVMKALAPHCKAGTFAPAALKRAVESHEADLEEMPFDTLADLRSSVDAGTGTILQAAVSAIDAEAGEAVAVVEAARAWGMVRLLRGLPYQAARRRSVLPRVLLARHSADPEALFSGSLTPELTAAQDELRVEARAHLDAARKEAARLSKPVRAFLGHISLAENYLHKMEAVGYNPFETDISLASYARIWSVFWSGWRGRI